MDALSDVLKSIRLEGAVYVNAEFSAPWCVHASHGLEVVKQRLPGAEHVVFFHYFTQGGCKTLANGAVLDVSEGDVVIFPQDDRQLLTSDLRLKPVEASTIPGYADASQVMRIQHGGGGEISRVVCGYIACSRSVSRLLFEALPPVVRIPVGDGPSATMLRELWRVGVSESVTERPGGESLLAKLSELLFVEALRRYVESLPPDGKGWLAGLRDAHVGRALALLHADPRRSWTVDELAREVALSRSALAERFATLVGEPPIQYLMRWRLALAAQSLRSSADPIIRVAERSGYESEAAFSRAFKREFGMPPAAWRKSAAPSPARGP
jgi:AraC-like DNA-binding protein